MPPQHPTSLHPITAASSSDSSSSTNTTPIIIGVSVGVGCFILLIVAFRVWKCTRRSNAPLPPKGPLAHDRQRQMTTAHPQSDLEFPVPMSHHGNPAPFANGPPFGDHSRQNSSRTDDSSIPPSPSVISSQVHLVQTPSGSEENGEIPRQRRPSFGSTASTVRHHYGHKPRSLSNAGSVRSTRSRQSSTHGTIRGPPHARHNRVDIVLPQPLAPGLYNTNSAPRQPWVPRSRTSSRERRSESRGEEYWQSRVSTDDLSSSAPESTVSTNYPPSHAEYPPPVPPIPTGFSSPSSSPGASNAPSPNLLDPRTPNSADPLLLHDPPSPESGPPPLPPPKDPNPRPSHRTRTRSDSARRQRA